VTTPSTQHASGSQPATPRSPVALLTALGLWLLLALPAAGVLAAEAVLQRIHMATVASHAVAEHAALYTRWLGYLPLEQGTVSEQQARSWGTPAMAGNAYRVLASPGQQGGLLRLVEISPMRDYRPLRSWGWNAIELLVEDPDAIHAQWLDSPFIHLGGPDFLSPQSPIRAAQYAGPAGEVFYLTRDTGDPAQSTLAQPSAPIDRPFILVVAGARLEALRDFYTQVLGASHAFSTQLRIPLLAQAQGLPDSHRFELGLLRLARFSHAIEVDAYPAPAGPRAQAAGELPPGVAMGSFIVDSLSGLQPQRLIAPPVQLPGKAYGGRRSATLRGAAGELIELLEQGPG